MKQLMLGLVCVLAVGCGYTSKTEVTRIPGTIVGASTDNFNEGAAVVGYLAHGNRRGGSLLGGAAWGALAAEGCSIRVELPNGLQFTQSSVPSSFCDSSRSKAVSVIREHTVYYKDGVETGNGSTYRVER